MKQLTHSSSLEQMIQQQIVERGIEDARVIDAMRQIPRELFLPESLRQYAHADRAAPVGYGQTISQPYIVALMSHRLDIRPEHRVLEIGTGTGYQTAILSLLAREVWTIERIKPLLDEAFERLMSLNLRNVHFRWGDGTIGWMENAPFDRVLIAAGAPDLPRELLRSQLADGGVAVLPIGPQEQQMLVEVRRHGEDLIRRDICGCRFVKLIGEAGWSE